MNVIQEITTQTSAGTSATAQSIGNLAAMALDLRESVAGFKLPEEDTGETVSYEQSSAFATLETEASEVDAQSPSELSDYDEVVDLGDAEVVDLNDEVELDIDIDADDDEPNRHHV